jgi:cytoskeletal protein CcmA (bactofilin family)
MNNNLSLGKDLTVNGNLYVNQYKTKQTITTLDYYLQVVEDLSVNGRIFMTGDSSLNGKLFVASDISANGNVNIGGNLRATYPTSSIPPSAIIGGVSTGLFTNDISCNSRFFLIGDSSMSGNLYVLGSTVNVGDASLNNRLFVAGDASFSGKLFATKDVSFNGNVVVGGSFTAASYPANSIPSSAISGLGGGVGGTFTSNVTTTMSVIATYDGSFGGRLYVPVVFQF